MEGTESEYVIDIRDFKGEGVDISLTTLRCGVYQLEEPISDRAVTWDEEHGVHLLTFPELEAGRYWYELYEISDEGENVVLAQGVLGVFASESWEEPELSSNSPNRTLKIYLGDDKKQLEATWLATSAASGYASKAKEYAQKLEDAMPLLEQASAFMESFDAALREAIKVVDNYLWIGGVNTGHKLKGEDGKTPKYGSDGYWYIDDERIGKARGDDGLTPYITSDGYWAIGNVKTSVLAAGRHGVDGTAVRRILVDSYEDIPWSGETCNGGFYYYVHSDEEAYATGWLKLVNLPNSDIGLYINGVHIYFDTIEYMPQEWADLINAANCGVTAVVDRINITTIKLTAKVAGAAGNRITLELGEAKYGEGAGIVNPSNEEISGATLTGGADAGWSVYAWLEPNGWVCVGLANDLATAEVHGLVKLGTAVVVADGAPVGNDANNALSVPLASMVVAGTGKLSAEGIVDGGSVGLDEEKAFRVPAATMDRYGTVKLSQSEEIGSDNTSTIGEDADGRVRVDWATLDKAGVIRLGSKFGQSNPEPYLVGIGATSDNKLANNYVFGGAIQHWKPAAWEGKMTWLDEAKAQNPSYFNDMFYSGLYTSPQFTQSQNNGLQLLPATGNMLAGVYLAYSIDDSRTTAVASAPTTKRYLQENYYTQGQLYTRTEADAAIKAALQPYVSIEWAEENYFTKTEAEAAFADKIDCPSKRIGHLEVITASEKEAMTSMDSKTLYLVIAG